MYVYINICVYGYMCAAGLDDNLKQYVSHWT